MPQDYVIDIDKGWKQILKDALKMKSVQLKVGLFGEGNSPQNNLAYRGVVHEFGIPEGIRITPKMRGFLHFIGIHVSPNTQRIYIPERPFMREAYDGNKSELERAVDKWYTDLIEGRITLKVFLDKIGILHTDHIKKAIQSGSFKPLHPVTILRKGSSKPLIDQGEMIGSVKHKVEGII